MQVRLRPPSLGTQTATGQLAGHEEEGNSSQSSATTSRPETGESERGSTFKGLGTSPVDSLRKAQPFETVAVNLFDHLGL